MKISPGGAAVTTNNPLPHASFIKAFADGIAVQWEYDYEAGWRPVTCLTDFIGVNRRFRLAAFDAAPSVRVPCPICGGEAIDKQDRLARIMFAPEAVAVSDCGEAGHAEGRCGNAGCSPHATRVPDELPVPSPFAGTMGAVHERGFAVGWNACRLEVLRLNAPPQETGEHYPFCKTCGWRMGGPGDSWDGVACKCGKTSP